MSWPMPFNDTIMKAHQECEERERKKESVNQWMMEYNHALKGEQKRMTVTFDTSFEDDTVEIEISPEDKKWFDDQEAQGESCANVPNTSSVEMQGGPCSIPGVSSVFNIDKQEVERSHSKCRCIEEHQDGHAHSAHVQ